MQTKTIVLIIKELLKSDIFGINAIFVVAMALIDNDKC